MKRQQKRCEFCHKKFFPKCNAQKICSSILCLRKQRKRGQDKWNEKNIIRLQKYKAHWYFDNRERLKEVRRMWYVNNIEKLKPKHREYNRSTRRKLVEQRRELIKPGIRLEEGCLLYNLGTARVDLETKKIMALAQLIRRVMHGKIESKQIHHKIKLIQKGETHHGYR